jgi:6-pyruvoyl-tetrahydropterin synthase
MPTGENLARFIWERVQAALGEDTRVTRVVVAEDATLSSTYEPE